MAATVLFEIKMTVQNSNKVKSHDGRGRDHVFVVAVGWVVQGVFCVCVHVQCILGWSVELISLVIIRLKVTFFLNRFPTR